MDSKETFKTIFFYDKEKAIEKYRNEDYQEREKAAIIAQIRSLLDENQVKNYELIPSTEMGEFRLSLEQGILSLRVKNSDPYYSILKTMLENKKGLRDEVTFVVSKHHFTLTSRNSTIQKTGKDISQIIEYLESMKNNGELTHVEKRGAEALEYQFDTNENERIRILVDADNKEVVSRLDHFEKTTVRKKNGLKRIVTGAVVAVALTVSVPYVGHIIKPVIAKTIEKDNERFDLQTNFTLMDHYYMMLNSGGLTNEEYDQFYDLVLSTQKYYENQGKTDCEDYKTLLKYQQLLDQEYQNTRERSL